MTRREKEKEKREKEKVEKKSIKGGFQVYVDHDFSQSRKNICHLTREKEKEGERREEKEKMRKIFLC